jgi:hypothetical protein
MSGETLHPAMAWRVRVRGMMGPTATQALRGFRVTHEEGLTVVEGEPKPGHGLASLLLDLQALGLEVVDIRRRRS